LSSDSTLIAVFEKARFSITLNKNIASAGNAVVVEEFDCINSVIMATPNYCYDFIHWADAAGNIISTKQVDTIILSFDSLLIAVFGEIIYTLTLNKNITIAGNTAIIEEIDCITSVIKAAANDCYAFIHWADSTGTIISTKQVDTIKLSSDSTLIAVFKRTNWMLLLDKNIAEAGEIIQTTKDDCITSVIMAAPKGCYNFLY
jgi:hypothetical protein